jgi:hypothetical protein
MTEGLGEARRRYATVDADIALERVYTESGLGIPKSESLVMGVPNAVVSDETYDEIKRGVEAEHRRGQMTVYDIDA